jgi:hypothetical protein
MNITMSKKTRQARTSQNKGARAYFSVAKAADTVRKNRKRKLERHAKAHPNDKQAAKAAKNPAGHKRKASRVKGNFPDAKIKTLVRNARRAALS